MKEMGLDGFDVTDNGSGIEQDNFDKIAFKHFTSKINQFDDLSFLNSYGFRGEALNALCELSGGISIITKTSNQECGSQLTFGADGRYL